MRDLLFRNLTSIERKRRILTSSEVFDKSGIRTVVRRHFIYIVKESPADVQPGKQPSYMFIRKESNSKEKTERFFCRIKNSVYAVLDGKIYLINFTHSLKICLTAIPEVLI